MKTTIAFPPENVYFIGYSDPINIHYQIVTPEQILTTERDVVETFDNEEEWIARLIELGVDEEMIQN
jgi:hypothetical protein